MKHIKYPAHIRITSNDTKEVQSVQDHCRNTAEYARRSVIGIGLENTAYLAGLLHDMGKVKDEFKEYIEYSAETGKRGEKTVNHTFAGVKYVLESYHCGEPHEVLASELIAYAIGAHHGLFDIAGRDKNGFIYRYEKENIGYEESVNNFHKYCIDQKDIEELFFKSVKEIQKWCDELFNISSADDRSGELDFFLGVTARLILSAVIEGDRRDTAEFMDFVQQSYFSDTLNLWERSLNNVEARLKMFSDNSPISKARHYISDQCRKCAEEGTGVYRLSVPTGAGKTLSSLRFALAHARTYDKKRIIFTAPLISILDQNAEIIREYIGNDNAILVHHSNLVEEGSCDEHLNDRELLKENWSAPIIITTLVQLLNTLFHGKASSIRRMNALCNSVIIIDEVQTVPAKLMTMFNLVVRFLSTMCNTTFVLCSATQPYLEGADHPIALSNDFIIKEMIPYDRDIWRVFKRTKLEVTEVMTEAKLTYFVREKIEEFDSTLVVCNTKKEAQTLYKAMSNIEIKCFQLSAAMCMAHRRKTLENIREAMRKAVKVICISTQVIEAGVDISFSCVIRVVAGMDSIVQSAGRCNRNGEYNSIMPVYIVRMAGEQLGNLKEIKDAQTATISLLEDYTKNREKYDNDLSSSEAIKSYYKRLYKNQKKGYQDYSIEGNTTIYSLLSNNCKFYSYLGRIEDKEYIIRQAFKTAGDYFNVFDEDTTDVIVPYAGGKDIIYSLQSEQAIYDLGLLNDLVKKSKPYIITIYSGQKELLLKQGYIYPIMGGVVYALTDGCYNMDMGLAPGSEKSDYLEVG